MKQYFTILGYKCHFENISHNCPALKLWGFSTEKALERAIRRELKKKGATP